MSTDSGGQQATTETVVVINTSPDTIDMLRMTLQHAGILVVSAFTYHIRDGKLDIAAFMREHRPRVIIYDIAPPYDANWRLFQHLRNLPAMKDVRWVITTTNAVHVKNLAGSDERLYEIVGKPYDLGEIATATKEALRARPTR